MEVRPEEIIVDLYELRTVYMRPGEDKFDRMYHDHQYAALSSAIAIIGDKYKVKSWDIEEEIRARRNKENTKKFEGVVDENVIKALRDF